MTTFLENLADKQFLQTGTRFTAGSQKYFINHIKRMSKASFSQGVINDIKVIGAENMVMKPGHMYTYLYDAKWKDKLPYWDKFPLIFCIDLYKDGWLGMNLHYLPILARAEFMRKLLAITNNETFNERTRLKLSYEMLKKSTKFKEFWPCLKRYLAGQVRSNILRINSTEWEPMLFLPTHQFQKKPTAKVWSDSRKRIRGH